MPKQWMNQARAISDAMKEFHVTESFIREVFVQLGKEKPAISFGSTSLILQKNNYPFLKQDVSIEVPDDAVRVGGAVDGAIDLSSTWFKQLCRDLPIYPPVPRGWTSGLDANNPLRTKEANLIRDLREYFRNISDEILQVKPVVWHYKAHDYQVVDVGRFYSADKGVSEVYFSPEAIALLVKQRKEYIASWVENSQFLQRGGNFYNEKEAALVSGVPPHTIRKLYQAVRELIPDGETHLPEQQEVPFNDGKYTVLVTPHNAKILRLDENNTNAAIYLSKGLIEEAKQAIIQKQGNSKA